MRVCKAGYVDCIKNLNTQNFSSQTNARIGITWGAKEEMVVGLDTPPLFEIQPNIRRGLKNIGERAMFLPAYADNTV
jgi:hypothetical protein